MYVSVIRLICVSTDPPYIKDVRSSETAGGTVWSPVLRGVCGSLRLSLSGTETSAGQSLREQIITRTCAIEWNHIYISVIIQPILQKICLCCLYIYIYISSPYISDQENKFTFEEK